MRILWTLMLLPALLAAPPVTAVSQEDQRRADEAIAAALEKLKELAEAETREERTRLAGEVGILFARATRADPDCDNRFFARFDDGDDADNKPLRAMLLSQFARGFCANKNWPKTFARIDEAIALNTRMTPHYRRLKQEFIRRKAEAERDD